MSTVVWYNTDKSDSEYNPLIPSSLDLYRISAFSNDAWVRVKIFGSSAGREVNYSRL